MHRNRDAGSDGPVATCTADEYQEHVEDFDGICVDCGEWHFGGIEGDAEGIECGECGAMAVMGVENALLTNRISISDIEDLDLDDGDEEDLDPDGPYSDD